LPPGETRADTRSTPSTLG